MSVTKQLIRIATTTQFSLNDLRDAKEIALLTDYGVDELARECTAKGLGIKEIVCQGRVEDGRIDTRKRMTEDDLGRIIMQLSKPFYQHAEEANTLSGAINRVSREWQLLKLRLKEKAGR